MFIDTSGLLRNFTLNLSFSFFNFVFLSVSQTDFEEELDERFKKIICEEIFRPTCKHVKIIKYSKTKNIAQFDLLAVAKIVQCAMYMYIPIPYSGMDIYHCLHETTNFLKHEFCQDNEEERISIFWTK